MKPRIGKRAFVPAHLLSKYDLQRVRKSLRFQERVTQRMQAILAQYNPELDELDDTVQTGDLVRVDEVHQVFGGYSLPRAWAIKHLDFIEFKQSIAAERSKVALPRLITPRDDKQREFFGSLLLHASLKGPQDILANAATGSGKTVAGIYLGQELGYRTLIVVDSNKIANGWLTNFRKFYGEEWTERYVGRIQQDRCEWKGKAFSIALAQSLARRRYPRAMYRAFGLQIVDEVHVFGAPHFAPILYMFNSRVRVGFTAENRHGSFGRRIKSHIEGHKVVSHQQVMQPMAWVLTNKIDHTFYCLTDGALLTNLSRLRARNAKLARLIDERGYGRDRHVLVLSNRTEQLSKLRELLIERGVPDDEIGLHMGQYKTSKWVIYYTYVGSTKRNRLAVVENRGTATRAVRRLIEENYSGFDLPASLEKRLEKGDLVDWEAERETHTSTQAELDNITNSCKIILATYEIFSKGVDVPRLDMGVEALPSGNVKQPLGRILRVIPDKKAPEWYAVHDVIELEGPFGNEGNHEAKLLNMFFEGKSSARMKALKKAGARIKFQ